MSRRDELIWEEAVALWRALNGDVEPPPDLTLQTILETRVPEVGYDRLCSPFLRPATISEPSRRRSA